MAKIKKTPRAKVSKTDLDKIRSSRGRDHSPEWDGHETWDAFTFRKTYYAAMQYYNLNISNKDTKGLVIKWMKQKEYDTNIINDFDNVNEWRCPTTMSSIASCLMRGMPEQRDDFNYGKNTAEWLHDRILLCIMEHQSDPNEQESEEESKPKNTISIQEKVYENTLRMCGELEEAIDQFMMDPNNWNPKEFKILNCLKGNGAKAPHAKQIQEYYIKQLNEIDELVNGEPDDQLKEAYNRHSKKNLRKLLEFYKEIDAACNMIMDESKAARKPRVKKPVIKEKLVEKLKYKKTDDKLKLVSTNPVNIIDSKELWCYDCKTRKLYKYISLPTETLNVKGTCIIGFDPDKSIGKTLRNPAEQLSQFRNAGKVTLRTFMDTINTLEIKANGRITDNQILLKTGT